MGCSLLGDPAVVLLSDVPATVDGTLALTCTKVDMGMEEGFLTEEVAQTRTAGDKGI